MYHSSTHSKVSPAFAKFPWPCYPIQPLWDLPMGGFKILIDSDPTTQCSFLGSLHSQVSTTWILGGGGRKGGLPSTLRTSWSLLQSLPLTGYEGEGILGIFIFWDTCLGRVLVLSSATPSRGPELFLRTVTC